MITKKVSTQNFKTKALIMFILFVTPLIFVGAQENTFYTLINDFKNNPNDWINSADNKQINDLLFTSFGLDAIKDNFDKLNDENILKLWDNGYEEKGRNLWDTLSDESKSKLLEAFEKETDLSNKRDRYYQLWNKLTEKRYTFDGSKKTETIEPNVEERDKLMKLLNKDQFQTLMKSVTGKSIALFADFDEQAFGYELKDGNSVWTLKKDDKTYFIPEKNLLDNLETILFKQIEVGNKKGQYGVFYRTSEIFTDEGSKGNIIMLQEGYLQKSDDKNQWIVQGLNPEKFEGGKVVIGLDPKQGQVEISEEGKIEMWGTGHLSGEDGVYVEMNGQRFFPHPQSPQTADKAYRYAFVSPLEKDVFNVRGNMQAKVDGKEIGIGLYTGNIPNGGVVSLKDYQGAINTIDKYNLDLPNDKKIDPNSLITLSSGGLNIKGTALNGKVSFSVSEDTKLKMSDKEFDIQSKNGENYYTYSPTERGLAKFIDPRKIEYVKGAEYVPRTDEVTQTTNGETRVGTGQTADGTTPTHINKEVQNALEEANKISTEKGNWATATEKDVTEEATKINEKVSTEEKSTTDLITNVGEVVIESVEDKETTTTNVPNAETRGAEQIQLPSLYQSTLVPGLKKYVDGSYSYYRNEQDKSTLQVQIFNRENLDNKDAEVYVVLSTSWCGPCQALKSNVQSSYQKYPDITFVYIDAEKQPALAAQYGGASSYPTVRRFKNGVKLGDGWGLFGR